MDIIVHLGSEYLCSLYYPILFCKTFNFSKYSWPKQRVLASTKIKLFQLHNRKLIGVISTIIVQCPCFPQNKRVRTLHKF